MILNEGLGWATAQAEDDHILQVSEQTCQHPTRGQIDISSTHPLNNFWRHGVHDITDQRD